MVTGELGANRPAPYCWGADETAEVAAHDPEQGRKGGAGKGPRTS